VVKGNVARNSGIAVALAVVVYFTPARTAVSEDRVDFKVLYHLESGDRMQVIAPALLVEKSLSQTLTLRVDGIYNTISGATPTGAPPIPRTVLQTQRPLLMDASLFHSKAGGSGSSSSSSSSGSSSSSSKTKRERKTLVPLIDSTSNLIIPTQTVRDTRIGGNVELDKEFERQTLSGALSYSSENDFDSLGLALRDGLHFNEKNTTLLLGLAYTRDEIHALTMDAERDKHTVDLIVGVTQLLGPKTRMSANLTAGFVQGYTTDPYKVVDLNGQLVQEKRPGNKERQIVYLSMAHFLETIRAGVEGGYRLYSDSFGVMGHTASVRWLQRLGDHLVLEPMIRYHEQSEADFYDVRFSGNHDAYSSDYRLSSLAAFSYGLKLVWGVQQRYSVDVGYERYEQTGRDEKTLADLYPSADVLTAGARLWF